MYRVGIAAALLLHPPLAVAQEAEASPATRADAAFRAGREAQKSGDFALACEHYRESQALDPSAGALVNLADCAERNRDLLLAAQFMRDALRMMSPDDHRRAPATERLAELDRRTPRLVLSLPDNAPPGVRVVLDGNEVASSNLGAAMAMNPGPHAIRMMAPSHETRREDVTAIAGETLRVVLALGEPSPPPTGPVASRGEDKTRPPGPRPSTRTTDRMPAYVATGVFAVGAAAATVTGVELLSKKSTVNAHCDAHRVCDSEGFDAASTMRTLVTLNTIAWLVAAGGAGGAVVFFLRSSTPETVSLRADIGAGRGVVVIGGPF